MECVEVDALFDDFSVDDLLDLSNADDIVRQETPTTEEEEIKVSQKQNNFSDQRTTSQYLSSGGNLLSVPGADLDFPVDDLAELQWLSSFVEDSFSEPYLSGGFPAKPNSFSGNDAPYTVASLAPEYPFFQNPVPTKARSKRRRTANDALASSSSSSSSSSYSPPISSNIRPTSKPATKKRRKRKLPVSGGGSGAHQGRRCSHCGVQKTPQWRMGPSGAKTLCNACGVRFKSGRLLPEYRPTCSPTFSSEIHSNSHRKVMELRRSKVVLAGRVDPG